MLRLHQVRLPLDAAEYCDDSMCRALAADRLGVPKTRVVEATVSRRSVDARDKGDVHFTLTLDVSLADERAEATLARKFKPNQVSRVERDDATDAAHMPMQPYPADRPRPMVVGAGPAGLFCALGLALRGAKPILLERGKPVEQRMHDIDFLEAGGVLNPESNVLFGEGGAGAFSDGKLTCGLNSPLIRTVLQTFVTFGAPEDILVSARPHIGSDLLRGVLKRMREQLLSLGAEVLFDHRLIGIEQQNGSVTAAIVAAAGAPQPVRIPTDALYLAIGHSARDTYAMLAKLGLPMQPKPFAIGVRIEHPQGLIDRAQYGASHAHPALPPADYKLNVPTPDGRGAYTFCMCPGGRVINASSEDGLLNINGMSLHARNDVNANAALLVGVTPADFPGDDPLAGVAFQRQIEQDAYRVGGDAYRAPCQRVEDFLADRPSQDFGDVKPSYRPGVTLYDVAPCLPDFVRDNLRFALPRLGQRLRGFDCPDALLTAVETRSSAPVRLLRDATRQSALRGLYPLGEGAGYAGGIVSAAVDGLSAGMDVTPKQEGSKA